jgi:hypothetical protein
VTRHHYAGPCVILSSPIAVDRPTGQEWRHLKLGGYYWHGLLKSDSDCLHRVTMND